MLSVYLSVYMYLSVRGAHIKGWGIKRQLYTKKTEFGGNPILIQITTLAPTGSRAQRALQSNRHLVPVKKSPIQHIHTNPSRSARKPFPIVHTHLPTDVHISSTSIRQPKATQQASLPNQKEKPLAASRDRVRESNKNAPSPWLMKISPMPTSNSVEIWR